jgi:hypothetical protein
LTKSTRNRGKLETQKIKNSQEPWIWQNEVNHRVLNYSWRFNTFQTITIS